MKFHLNRLQPNKRYYVSAFFLALLQSFIVFYIVESRAAILRNGQEVLLMTEPVDPNDILRGDYVVLNYANVSLISGDTLVGDTPVTDSRFAIWVRLKKQSDSFWRVTQSSFQKLAPQPGTVILQGTTSYSSSKGGNLFVNYGIERYYVPEGKGLRIENASRTGSLSVSVKISDRGIAQISQLFLDRRAIYEEPLY